LGGSTLGEPTLGEPTLGEPTLGEPTLSEPTLSDPTLGEPTLGEPTLSDPTLGEPTLSDPTGDAPTVDKSMLDKPMLDKPMLDAAAPPPSTFLSLLAATRMATVAKEMLRVASATTARTHAVSPSPRLRTRTLPSAYLAEIVSQSACSSWTVSIALTRGRTSCSHTLRS
jgi:hypothetical protein